MMKLRINPLVAQDLKSIKNYIAEDNADKALKQYRRFTASLKIYSSFLTLVQTCLSV